MDYGPLPNCGELWLLSGLWDEQSEVANGDFEGDEINDLVETFMGDLVGESVFDKYGEQFPLTYLPFSFLNDMMCGTKQFGEMTAFTTQGAGGWGFHFKLPASCEVAKVTINFGVK